MVGGHWWQAGSFVKDNSWWYHRKDHKADRRVWWDNTDMMRLLQTTSSPLHLVQLWPTLFCSFNNTKLMNNMFLIVCGDMHRNEDENGSGETTRRSLFLVKHTKYMKAPTSRGNINLICCFCYVMRSYICTHIAKYCANGQI